MSTFETAHGHVDTKDFPEATINALLLRGMTHVYGNETASKIVASIRKNVNPEKPGDVTGAQVAEWREANEDAVAELTRKTHEDFTKALREGTLGTRAASGPRLDPVARELRQRATSEVVAILKNVGAIGKSEKKYPAQDELFTIAGQEVAFGALIDRRIANPKEGPRLKKEAEDHVKALARQKARAEAQAVESAKAGTLEDMGL
jgi:hypothetical protein